MIYRTGIHKYIHRSSGEVREEKLFYDRVINSIYSIAREDASFLYRLVTSKRMSALLAFLNYDLPGMSTITGGEKFIRELNINLEECCDSLQLMNSARKIFERKIRYREFRPMEENSSSIVSPADSRMIIGSLSEESCFFIKEKFFSFNELLGDKARWLKHFENGDYAIFRLTPEKYHYSHVPVDGVVEEIYEIDGVCNSCNPGVVMSIEKAYSKNRRVITIINTDVSGGTGVGRVAMIEIAALMIGEIVQCYSEQDYENPSDVYPGLFLKKGQPKSLFRPGSSVDMLIFEKNRMRYSPDIIENSARSDVESRFSSHFKKPLVETDLMVREKIGEALI